jgi:hypothetical protein
MGFSTFKSYGSRVAIPKIIASVVEKTKCIKLFTIVGQTTFTTPSDVSEIEILLIGGGGGGGASIAGGGGGGGFVYKSNYVVASNTNYIINVGSGGTGDTNPQNSPVGMNGGNSSFGSLISHGGGGGGEYRGGENGKDGASGGDAAFESSPGSAIYPNERGNNGGASVRNNGFINGGGGGAGTAGGIGFAGDGLESSISGTATYYSGGGGGGQYVSSHDKFNGGLGGGGQGYGGNNTSPVFPNDGHINSGGGGGGGENEKGGNGGSGIVIITYISSVSTIIRPMPFIWLKFDSGDITNTTTLKNYGSQGTDATLNKVGTGAYPQLLTTGQSVGTGCISLVGGQEREQNGGYVSMSPITTTTDGMTFAIWFKFQPDGTILSSTRLIDFQNNESYDFLAYFENYSHLSSYMASTGNLVENYEPAFNTGEWFHYATTINPNGEWNVYINGTFISTKTIGYPAVKTININSLGKSGNADALLTAQLDDFRYYNVPLSDDDVLALYNKTY